MTCYFRGCLCNCFSFGLLLIISLSITGCYRVVSPTDPGEAVAVTINIEQTRLVREQLYLTQQVTREIQDQLGWIINPQGTATLTVTIIDDQVRPTASGDLDIPSRWEMKIIARVEFTSQLSGTIGTTVEGVGNVSKLADEGTALRTAAGDIASDIRTWLENSSYNWKPIE